MARPGLTQHRKFLRLARLLGSAPMALGSLELMWEKCYLNGEAYLGDVVDVEAASQWPGEPGALCKALLDAGGDGNHGFIEEVQGRPGHYQCHDLFDHAPRYVAKRMAREMERKEKGETLSQIRADAGKAGGKQTASKRTANGQQNPSKGTDVDAPPAPAPAPAPAPLKTCGAPGDPGTPPAILILPCVGSGEKEWPVTEEQLTKWREAYPGVDVVQEVRKMRLWLEDSPTRRKTYAGMGRFALGWLGRAQNDARGGARASPRVAPLQTAMASDVQARAQVQKFHVPKLPAAGGAR